MTKRERKELLAVRDRFMRDTVEVVERAGFFEARRRGTSGRVFHRDRTTAVERAKDWSSKHVHAARAIWDGRNGQEVKETA